MYKHVERSTLQTELSIEMKTQQNGIHLHSIYDAAGIYSEGKYDNAISKCFSVTRATEIPSETGDH